MRPLALPVLAAALVPLGAQGVTPSSVRTFTLDSGRVISVMAFQGKGLLYELKDGKPVILDPAALPAPTRDLLRCQAPGSAQVSWRALTRWLGRSPLVREKGDGLFQGFLEKAGKRWVLHQGSRPASGRLDLPAPVGPEPGGPGLPEGPDAYLLMNLPDPAPEPGPILILGRVDPDAATADQRGEAVLAVKAWGRP